MEYEIVSYRPEFKEQVVELQKHLWSLDRSVNVAHLEWKYEHNPYVDRPLIYVALYGGKVVGMRGLYGAEWQVGCPPQKVPALGAGDLVIAPEHRDRGLFTRIMKTAFADLAGIGYTHVFNLSAGPVTRLGSLTMGWRSAGSLQMMYWRNTGTVHQARRGMRTLLFRSGISRRVGRGVYRLMSLFRFSAEKDRPFAAFDKNSVQRQLRISPYVRAERTPRIEAMTELVERGVNDGRIRHVRDQHYFTWRFNNPLAAYRFLFWEDGGLEGYLVLQRKLYKDRVRVNVVDWEATSPQVWADLLRAAIRLGGFDTLTIWSATLSDEAKVLLQGLGFAYFAEKESLSRSSSSVLVRPTRDEMLKADWVIADRRVLDLASWDLRMTYSDSY